MSTPFKMRGFSGFGNSPLKDKDPHTGLNPPHTKKNHPHRWEKGDLQKSLDGRTLPVMREGGSAGVTLAAEKATEKLLRTTKKNR